MTQAKSQSERAMKSLKQKRSRSNNQRQNKDSLFLGGSKIKEAKRQSKTHPTVGNGSRGRNPERKNPELTTKNQMERNGTGSK